MANPMEKLQKGLKSMARPKKDKKEEESKPCEHYEENPYPYGLRIDLNNDSMTALGLDASDFTAGGTVMLVAKCDVTSVHIEDRVKIDGKENKTQSVDLQITDLSVIKEEAQ
jgi:hypothetical protein